MDDREKSFILQKELALDPIVADLLVKRGFGDVDSARAFLHPSLASLTPLSDYDGIDEIAQRLRAAVDSGESIVIYGDYDCDGVCAVSILYGYLSKVSKGKVNYYIPNRHSEGYGISVPALEYIAENTDAQVVISVDCGINSVEEVDYAQQELGFDMLITDHHQPGEKLPDCPVFNPHVSARTQNAFRDLCGAGVALRIVEALAGQDESKKYYDIAALATVADVVPLVGDNRVITYYGLVSINKKYRRGINLLVDSCIKGSVTSSDIAFRLAPRINAMGRVKDANEVVQLFVENDLFLLKCLVDEINKANDVRQQLTDDLTEDCLEKLRDYDFENNLFIVLYAPYWDDGVLGITASRLVGLFSRPVILFTKNKGVLKGSGRSVAGVNILDCVKHASCFLTRFGGHPMACGVGLEEDKFDDFRNTLSAYAKEVYGNVISKQERACDCVIIGPVSIEVTKQLMMLQPFGEGNPAPVFAVDEKKCSFVPFGDGSHLKSRLKNMEILGFGMSEDKEYFNSDAEKRFYLDISYSVFNNVERTQAVIRNVLPLGLPDDDVCYEYNLKNRGLASEKDKDIQIVGTDEKELERLKNKPYGVCFVAFDKKTAERAAELLGLSVVFGKGEGKLPETRIILCPSKGATDFYSDIILLGKPLAGINRFAIKGKVCVAPLTDISALYRENAPTYEEFGRVFKAIRGKTTQHRYNDVGVLYADIAVDCAVDKRKFLICFYVFEELGLLSYGSDIRCIGGKKVELSDSALYRAICNG